MSSTPSNSEPPFAMSKGAALAFWAVVALVLLSAYSCRCNRTWRTKSGKEIEGKFVSTGRWHVKVKTRNGEVVEIGRPDHDSLMAARAERNKGRLRILLVVVWGAGAVCVSLWFINAEKFHKRKEVSEQRIRRLEKRAEELSGPVEQARERCREGRKMLQHWQKVADRSEAEVLEEIKSKVHRDLRFSWTEEEFERRVDRDFKAAKADAKTYLLKFQSEVNEMERQSRRLRDELTEVETELSNERVQLRLWWLPERLVTDIAEWKKH